jgi:hypothetical protein
VKEVDNGIWLVSFMDYDRGYIDLKEKHCGPSTSPSGQKCHLSLRNDLLPMCRVCTIRKRRRLRLSRGMGSDIPRSSARIRESSATPIVERLRIPLNEEIRGL